MKFLNAKSASLIFITIVSISIVFTAYILNKTEKKLLYSVENLEKNYVSEYAKNIADMIESNHFENIVQDLKKYPGIRKKLNKQLSYFSTKQFKYVYVVYLDRKGNFRYLLDGSKNIKERGVFLQRFYPENKMWKLIYKTGKQNSIIQKKVYGVWMTYLYPIRKNNKTVALVAIDTSMSEYKKIEEIFTPMANTAKYISIVLLLITLLTYIQTYLLYREHKKSVLDPLTGLYNRNYLNTIMNKLDLTSTAVAIVDIDYFKRVNDTYGHDIGDLVLREIAYRLKYYTRSDDIVIRIGGEEFLIIFQHYKNTENIKEAVKRIQKLVSSKPVIINNNQIDLSVSIGLNADAAENKNINQAIQIADKMLYAAKTNGRNRVEIYDAKQKVFLKNRLEDVAKIVDNNGLSLFYQPILDVQSMKIEKYEALIRLKDEDGSIIYPDDFLPIIKNTSTYRKMSKFVLENAFNVIEKYKIAVNVNFDIGDFLDNTLFEQIKQQCESNKKLSSNLVVELLEDKSISDLDKIYKRIMHLKELGIAIAIDNFGTGYSNFDYIMKLSPDIVKIDGSLIKNIDKNKNSFIIVKKITEICKLLHLKVTGEFIETYPLLTKLQELEIDYAQGYLIGKPIPAILKDKNWIFKKQNP